MNKSPVIQRRIELRVLMAEHDLSCADVAAILGLQVNTVRMWTSRSLARPITNKYLEALKAHVKH